jgi:hypothetical protein
MLIETRKANKSPKSQENLQNEQSSKLFLSVDGLEALRIPPLPPIYNFGVFEGCCLALAFPPPNFVFRFAKRAANKKVVFAPPV